MKIYNLNIDTSKPVKKVMQMQQNETGLLKLNVTNGGKSIRNLTTKVYDGETEVPSTDNGFKIDMGKNDKVVKIEAKSEPIMCQMGYFVSKGSGSRVKGFALSVCQLSQGVYSQDEFKAVADELRKHNMYGVCFPTAQTAANINISEFRVSSTGEYEFRRNEPIPEDEPIVVTGDVEIFHTVTAKSNAVTGTYDYPAFGEYTDYQLDTTIRPSANAPYDGDYTEPLTEVEVDGVKFVPTTLTIDGVEYKVLVEAQPEPEGIVLSRPSYVFDPQTDDPSTFPKQIGYLPAGEYAQEEVIRWLSAFAVDVDVDGTQAKMATLVFAENEQTPPENSNIVMANLVNLGDGSGDQIEFLDGRMQPISSEGLNLVITGDGLPVWWGSSLSAQYYMDCPAVSVTVQQTT